MAENALRHLAVHDEVDLLQGFVAEDGARHLIRAEPSRLLEDKAWLLVMTVTMSIGPVVTKLRPAFRPFSHSS
jgi:hypothetical protein